MLSPSNARPHSGASDRDEPPAAPAVPSMPSRDETVVVVCDKKQRDRDRKRRERHGLKARLVLSCLYFLNDKTDFTIYDDVMQTNVEHMKKQIAVLEAAAAAVATLGVEDAAWDDFLDDDAKRMRTFLRKSFRLTKDAEQLTRERTVRDQLLREHDLWAATMDTLLKEQDASQRNDWAWNVTRWHALSRAYFTPWTLD